MSEVRAGRRSASPRLVTAVLAIVDRIGAMIDAIEAGQEIPVRGDDVLIAALESDSDDLPDLIDNHLPDTQGTRSVSSGHGAQRSIRLPTGLLDSVMSSVSDLVLARNDLARRMRDAGVDPTVQGPFERLATILDQVRDAVTRMRMQRIEHLFGALPRLVRDLSAELGKQVMIDLEGGDVELDREMIEMIRDPLTHIIRNAIDHGIENPSQRLAVGKREIGTLHISAHQSGNRIMLAIADDGRGIDGARLVEKAIASGALARSDGDSLDEAGRHALIFEPGLSTAAEVTAVSGRGVGMDVVRANIERIGGSIEVTSQLGLGTRIVLSLPLTLSIIPSLTVGAGDQLFAMPRSYVDEIVHGRASHIEFARAGDAVLVTVRGKRVACLSLGEQLGLPHPLPPEDSTLVLVRLASGDLFALAVDRIFDHEELVIKPLAPAVMGTGIYAGSTLLDDGNPVLMLDVAGIARKARVIGDGQKRARAAEDAVHEQTRRGVPALLFVGLDGSRKVVRLGAIQRIERIAVSGVDLASDPPRAVIGEALFPLAGVAGASLPVDQVSVLRLGDGDSEIAFAIDRIVDTVDLTGEIAPARRSGLSEGTVLIDGVPAEVLDTHWLFASFASPPRSLNAPVCRLPGGDQWARTILAPLIESAGYHVVDESFEGDADVVIATEAGGEPVGTGAVITLCTDPEKAGQLPGALYRYDRAGLVAALAALRSGRAA